ncbi:MAG: DUF1573 domain-containing protein [Bacteroidales bacterium]|nr:DUF1573 domain-containing protein [Bacteroidales bacterium]
MKKLNFLIAIVLSSVFVFAQKVDQNDADPYPYQMGKIKMDQKYVLLGDVDIRGTHTTEVKIINSGDSVVTFSADRTPRYLNVDVPSALNPGEEGTIKFVFNSGERNQYGRFYYHVNILTNDELMPAQKLKIGISANCIEDFANFTDEQLALAPKIEFENTEQDYGEMIHGQVAKFTFEFTNTGKSELIIRKTKASCGCTIASAGKKLLQPGESSEITVEFDSGKKQPGKQTKSVTVISNDPSNSVQRLMFRANVLKKSDEE